MVANLLVVVGPRVHLPGPYQKLAGPAAEEEPFTVRRASTFTAPLCRSTEVGHGCQW
jgi:hypothetical protein